MDAKVHHALVVSGVVEFGIAHRAGQIAKEKRRTLFVIPHMRTGAHAATGMIVVSLPAKQTSIRSAEARLRPQGAEIEKSGFLYDLGQVACREG